MPLAVVDVVSPATLDRTRTLFLKFNGPKNALPSAADDDAAVEADDAPPTAPPTPVPPPVLPFPTESPLLFELALAAAAAIDVFEIAAVDALSAFEAAVDEILRFGNKSALACASVVGAFTAEFVVALERIGFVRFDDDDDALLADEPVVTGRVDVLAVFRGVRCFFPELIEQQTKKN